MILEKCTILLTGFGPFPGTPSNVSGPLAETLSRRLTLRVSFSHIVLNHVLPVDWSITAEAIATLHRRHRPALAIHFGVSADAPGLLIERTAHNACDGRPDVFGACSHSAQLEDGGPPRRRTSLKVEEIVDKLTLAGHPVALSDDPGRYLCNAAYYASLFHAEATNSGSAALFVHLPTAVELESPAGEGLLAASEALVEAAAQHV